ncbi:MAG TPA: LamG domain-containing protein, partial [Puia sp.]
KNDTLYAVKPDSTVNLTKGLLLYLPFSGNVADSSGNANPTTAFGNVLTYDAHGYANSAFGSNGTGTQKVYVTNNGSIQFDTAYSLSLGFMTNDTLNQGSYVSMIDPTTGMGVTFNLGQTTSSTNHLAWGTEDYTLGCSAYGRNDAYNLIDTTNFTPIPGAWYNAIVVYHKGATQIYINGNLVYTKVGAGTKANLCPSAKIVIGAWWDSDPLRFNGKLDNIRLYNRVLTPHEIVALSSNYQITSNSVKPGLRTH